MVTMPRMHTFVLASLLLLASLSTRAAPAKPAPPFELDRQTLALGEALTLRMNRNINGKDAPLETLDLNPLRQDFDILERTLGRDSQQENLAVTLYPRRLGRITLPTLGRTGKAASVIVTEGSDNVPKVFWKISLDPAEPLVRQASTLTLEACDDGTLLWKRPALPAAQGLLLRPLNETEIITQRNGQRCTAHRWHWALLPTAAGQASVNVPVMEASKFGKRLRFTPPTLAVTAQALPSWLPDEVAIGKPDITAEPLPAQAVLNQPLAWRLRITGSYSAQALQTLLNLQLQSGEQAALAAYAPRIEPQASQTPESQHLVTLYLLPRTHGPWQVPDLQLPWFDPKTAQLQQIRIAGSRMEVIDPAQQRWLLGLAALAGLGAAAGLGFWLWKTLGWRLHRRIALKHLRQCDTPEALSQRLLAFSLQRNARSAPTLRAWQTRMQQQCQSSGLAELVDTLERCRFGALQGSGEVQETPAANTDPMDTLIQLACAWIKSVAPLPKHLRPSVAPHAVL
jgi:hypothetical protein